MPCAFRTVAATLLLLFSLIASAGPACEIRFDSAVLDTCSGALDAHPAADPALLAPAPESGGLRVIKYHGPITESDRRKLAEEGVEVIAYLPWFAYLARAPEGVPDDPAIAWQGEFLPVWRVENQLLDLDLPEESVALPLELVLWRDANIAGLQQWLLGDPRVDFRFHTSTGRSHVLGIKVDSGQFHSWLIEAALLPEVRSISLRRPARLLNSQAGWLHQSGDAPGNLPVFEQGIFGCGQVVGVLDSGFDYGSCAFRDPDLTTPQVVACSQGVNCPAEPIDENHRKIALYYNWSGQAAGDSACGASPAFGHGTHVAGSISGNRLDNPADCETLDSPGDLSNFDGTAPGARLITQQAGSGLEYLNNFGGNIYHAARIAYESGARIHNNSWGSGCCFLGLICICSEPQAYTGNAPLADEVAWEFPELLVAVAAGNDGSCCGTGSIGNPALAKNVLTVGATNRGAAAEGRAGFSSQGPTRDRRIKPDVMAQGNNIVSAGATTNPASPSCTECTLGGTSMASPTAAGLAALVRDYLARGFHPTGLPNPADAIENPPAALVRAILINSGRTMTGSGSGSNPPNQQQGWGRVTLDDALYFEGNARRLWFADPDNGLVSDEVDEHQLTVDADAALKITLVWHDFPGEASSDPSIVNLLRLEVETPSGEVLTQKLPSSGPPNPFWDNGSEGFDDRNTVHQLTVADPEAGAWQLRVRGISVAMGDAQPYALVVTGAGISAQLPELIFADAFESTERAPPPPPR